jgi:hypothetical protein
MSGINNVVAVGKIIMAAIITAFKIITDVIKNLGVFIYDSFIYIVNLTGFAMKLMIEHVKWFFTSWVSQAKASYKILKLIATGHWSEATELAKKSIDGIGKKY